MPLTVLGMSISIMPDGLKLIPDREKCMKWGRQIAQALDLGRLTAGEASKLAGRLSWASSACFRKAGRTLLYPIYKQQRSRSSTIGPELRLALEWWLQVCVPQSFAHLTSSL